MKQTLLFSLSLLISGLVFSQNQIFISEYVEGSGTNKAIELYNPTNADMRLQDQGLRLVRYSNGDGVGAGTEVLLTGTVPANGTWVAVSDKRDPNATGQDTMVNMALQAKADTFLCPVYNVNKMFYFNGNDAITLEKANGVYVDIIGEIGVNPGIAWTMDANAGYTSALGGRWWTANHTLVRKPSVTGGVIANPSPFIVATEWDSLPEDDWSNLGIHNYGTGINDVVKTNNAFFYPNPVTDGYFMVKATEVIESVELMNVIGQSVSFTKNPSQRGDIRITTDGFTKGMYVVRIIFADKTDLTKKVIIR
jgi:hypothetical protein